jgi:alanyl-tRNA synthetase
LSWARNSFVSPDGEEALLVLDKTPFYAESGGQVADHGIIQSDGGVFAVTGVHKSKGGKFLHAGTVTSGSFHVDDTVEAVIDLDRRKAVMRAIRRPSAAESAPVRSREHVQQAVPCEPDRLRFDITHFSALTPEEIEQIERLVNQSILEGYPVVIREMPIAEAKKIGAMALFGEKIR